MIFRFVARLAAIALLSVMAHAASPKSAPVVLVSLDGFRWDYCDLHPDETPNLRRMKREGVSARGLVPVFPSNTFPNHYTLVTGLYPAHHGIINNHMFDPRTGEFFHYNTPKSAHEPQWWGGEPIWITAVKQGQVSGCSYWPGSEAEIGGAHATYWRPFDYFDIPFESRLEWVLAWYRRPAAERPAVVTFYIEEANAKGHDFGPDSPELVAQLKTIDAQVGQLQAGLIAEGVTPNLVVVSDHGMTAVSHERLLILDDYLDLTSVQIEDAGSTVGLRPLAGTVDELEKRLATMPHAKIYRAEALPAHLHLRGNARIPPLWILPDEGWRAETRAIAQKPRVRTGQPLRGDHGYDPSFTTMRGIFIASGPAFKSGVQIPEVENIHVYNLLCAVAGLKPAPNDGDDRLVKAALR
jgi:predicted AlkP superfamily pyrophosphatase or phosphodiesterase